MPSAQDAPIRRARRNAYSTSALSLSWSRHAAGLPTNSQREEDIRAEQHRAEEQHRQLTANARDGGGRKADEQRRQQEEQARLKREPRREKGKGAKALT
jgi:hypothetical protein